MNIKYYEMNREDLERFSATVMHTTLGYLEHEELLTSKQADKIADTCSPIIVMRHSVLQRLADRIFNKPRPPEDTFIIRIIEFSPKPDANKGAESARD